MTTADPIAPRPATPAGTTVGLYVATVFLWGTSWIAIHWQLGTVAPEVSVLWRFVVAAALMTLWAVLSGVSLRFSPSDHARFAAVGLTLFSTNFLCFYYSGRTIPSGLLAVVFSLASVVNLGLGRLLFGQRVEARAALAGLAGVTGVALMFWPQLAGQSFDARAALGLALSLAGTLSFCIGNQLSASTQRSGVPVIAGTTWGMIYGACILALFVLMRDAPVTIEWTPRYLLSLLWLGAAASVAGFVCYLTLVGRIGTARAGYVTVLFPVVALAISTVFEGYHWTAMAVAGLALVLAGNALILSGRR
jgi:drug/metabolite transporter (DMT)-like permease